MTKDLQKIIFGFILCVCSLIVSAQEINNVEQLEMGSFADKESLIGKLESSSLSVWNGLSRVDYQDQNSVFIQQIGASNTANAAISSPDAMVTLKQRGHGNNIDIDIEAKKVRYNFLQNGDNNRLTDFAIEPSEEISLNLTQQGDNNTFERMGANSIGSKLQFQMTGNKTVIVRNFK